MKFSDKGIPILSLEEKVFALSECLYSRERWDDAAGHLCDLLEFCRQRIVDIPARVPVFDGLPEMIAYYGKEPTPIEDKP
jgi:hypothetical protein